MPSDSCATARSGRTRAIHFANHHESHALAALFYTDWNDALVYTSDGIGDNVSYSMRFLKNGKLECHYGDDRWLTRTLKETGLASAYGYATVACGFKMLRHEGKLTGLSAYGEPKLADEMAAWFRFNGNDGLIETDFRNWAAMREKFLAICQGHDRETIAASIQKVAEDFTAAVGALVARPQRRAPARARRRAVRQCAAEPAARRNAAARRGLHLSGDGRRRPAGRRRARVAARARRHRDMAAAPPSARQRLSRQELRRRDRRHAVGRRDAAARGPAGRDRGRPDPRRQGGRDLYRPHGIRPARARRPLDHREPARPRHQRQPEQAARPLGIHAVRALSCWRKTRAACSRSPT